MESSAASQIKSSIDSIILSIFPRVSTHISESHLDDLYYYGNGKTPLFPHDYLLAAVSVAFCRYTIKSPGESLSPRLIWAAILSYLAFHKVDFWMIIALQLCSYYQFTYNLLVASIGKQNNKKSDLGTTIKRNTIFIIGQVLAIHLIYSIANPSDEKSMFQSRIFKIFLDSSIFSNSLTSIVHKKAYELMSYLFPIDDGIKAYNLLTDFIEPSLFNLKIWHLLFVTFEIQVGMGYLGIDFLRNEQERKNALIRIESDVKNEKEKENESNEGMPSKANHKKEKDLSKKFRNGAAPFIFIVAVPYMVQIILFGGINKYASQCFTDDIHRQIRLKGLFGEDGTRFVGTASQTTNYQTPGEYAANVDIVVNTVYDIVNDKLFSLPKLLLLPQMIAKQPMLLLKITPLIIFSDYIKSSVVATMNKEAENSKKESRKLKSRRTKIEQYDMKNSELIQRSGVGSIPFTEQRWVTITEELQDLNIRVALINRTRMYFAWLQRNFVMMVLVDCALAKLIAVGKIVSADIFVYARAIEDMINLVLMKSRSESELASMASSIELLNNLKNVWDESEKGDVLSCTINESQCIDATAETCSIEDEAKISIRDLAYSRGSASITIDNLSLGPGVTAVTGANGSGKSTLFRLLMGCETNRKSIVLASSIVISSNGSIEMPSSDVVEISQNFYWPLFTKPVDWMYHSHLDVNVSNGEREEKVKRAATELNSLNFYGGLDEVVDNEEDGQSGISYIQEQITEEKEDWFADLSGGQKSKAELVRKVFLADQCPKVLFIDETFAPLDPDSKSLVMRKIKDFCKNSIVLVIYHADVSKGTEDEEEEECVPSSNFFDTNIHVENGAISLRPVCSE